MKKSNNSLYRIISTLMAIIMMAGMLAFSAMDVNAAGNKKLEQYAPIFDATYYSSKYADVKAAYGNDAYKLLTHFLNCGMKEGRQGSEEFNVQAYRARYADLQAAFGDDLTKYYMHYLNSGKAEGRDGKADTKACTDKTCTNANNSVQAKISAYCYKCGCNCILDWTGSAYKHKTCGSEYSYEVVMSNATASDKTIAPSYSTDPSKFEVSYYAQLMMGGINDVREQKGLKTLAWDEDLAKAAQTRAEEYTSRPHAKSKSELEEKYDLQGKSIIECMRYTYAPASYFTSSAHKAQLEDPYATRCGVGVYFDGTKYYYFAWVY